MPGSCLNGLTPDMAAWLARFNQRPKPAIQSLPPLAIRAGMRKLFCRSDRPPHPLAQVQEQVILGPVTDLRLRLYRPLADELLPVLVFYHGGGWVACDLDTHDDLCRALAAGARSLVVSVDYPLAPEHKFPAAVEAGFAALNWVAEHAAQIQGDVTRLAVGGDSAGGNLATVMTLLARDRQGPALIHQLLLYPITDIATLETASHHLFATGYFLERAAMLTCRDYYFADLAEAQQPYASPLLAPDLSGLPPAQIITAGFDLLRDEGAAYADRLRADGVQVKHTCYEGLIHGFLNFAGELASAQAALDEIVSDLRVVLYN